MKKVLLSILILLSFQVKVKGQLNSSFTASVTSGCSPLAICFQNTSTGNPTSYYWTFGNGNSSILQNPCAIYLSPGPYTVTLVVSDGVSWDTLTQSGFIQVNTPPVSDFGIVGTFEGCPPLQVQFADSSQGLASPIVSWLWDFGDGTFSTLQNPIHTYQFSDTVNVKLKVTDASGCVNVYTMNDAVKVWEKPTADFSSNLPMSCLPPLNVNFDNHSSTSFPPLLYQWDFGDGGTSTTANPSHYFIAQGIFTPSLIATNNLGCKDTLSLVDYVNVQQGQANILVDSITCTGAQIRFEDVSSGARTDWEWYFGDGAFDTLPDPYHTYSAPGWYDATLIISVHGTCYDTLTLDSAVHVIPPPVLEFVPDTVRACDLPYTINLTNLSQNTFSWKWDFWDGGTSTAMNPTHTYGNQNDTLPITLYGYGPPGCSDSLRIESFYIGVNDSLRFYGSPRWGCLPFTVNFNGIHHSPAVPGVSWLWDFGDGTTSTLEDPVHTYTTPGFFTVTVTTTTDSGCVLTRTYQDYIGAGNPTLAGFSLNPTLYCPNTPIGLTNTSASNANIWLYSFNNGLSWDTTLNYNQTYALHNPGCYNITQLACNYGCCDTANSSSQVCINQPGASFGPVGEFCQSPVTISFSNNSTGVDSCHWNFGDGTTSSLLNPVHTFLSQGLYWVTLRTWNFTTGCSNSTTWPILVHDFQANFISSPNSGCGPLTTTFTSTTSGSIYYHWNFGDGQTGNGQTVTHTYANPGTYTVSLAVFDGIQCFDSIQIPNHITVTGASVNFGADTLRGCSPLLVNFTDSTTGFGLTSWLWKFGDGTISTQQNPSHLYATPGYYDVRLTVTDASGCSRELLKHKYILVTDPQADFIAEHYHTCPNDTIHFTDISDGLELNYIWDFGDGVTDTLMHPEHAYDSAGWYTVSLQISDINGCRDSLTMNQFIQIEDISVDFAANPLTGSCPPMLVSFFDSSAYDVTYWDWDFGDGNHANLPNPTHIYSSAGLFNIELEILTATGCRDSLTDTAMIRISGPTGTFTFSPNTGCTPQTIHFIATALNTYLYTWDFGDGNIFTSPFDSVDHTYVQSGTFHPILVLGDTTGCQIAYPSPDSLVIDTIPSIQLFASQWMICPGDTIHFSDSIVSPHAISSWIWDFGDGDTSHIKNPSHAYTAPGNYSVSLTVVSSQGCTNSDTNFFWIHVIPPPVPSFGVSPPFGCRTLTAFFSDSTQSPIPIQTWNWSFGDGASDSIQNPIHFFGTPGNYVVVLNVADSIGCSSSRSDTLMVFPGSQAQFSASDTMGCMPFPITFQATSGAGTFWFWNFGDGNLGVGNPTIHTYSSSGLFSISLIEIDTNGCRDTLLIPDLIFSDSIHADFLPQDTASCPLFQVAFSDFSYSDSLFVSWWWDFGDGTNSSNQNPIHTFSTPGNYDISLVVSDIAGCIDTLLVPNAITVFNPPAPSFLAFPDSICAAFPMQFFDQSTASASLQSWHWDFGDGSLSTLQNPVHVFQNGGTYLVTLTVLDSNGCSDSINLPVVVLDPPTAQFILDDSTGCIPFSPNFTSLTSNMAVWTWDFGDGGTGSGEILPHTYLQPGYFAITHIVVDTFGCADTLVAQHLVFTDSIKAGFLPHFISGCPLLTSQFSDFSWSDTTLVSWQWNFGDGGSSSMANPSHLYTAPGFFDVSLTITNAIGCTDSVSIPAAVEIFSRPQANILANPGSGCEPLTVQFSENTAGPAPVTVWNWDFNGMGSSALATPTYTFSSAGNPFIILIVTDSNGCKDTANTVLPVYPKPIALANGANTQGCYPLDVFLTCPVPGMASYDWDLGDGQTVQGQSVTHQYITPGYYSLTLTITSMDGCQDTLVLPHFIFADSLSAEFSSTPLAGCEPFPVTFYDHTYSDTSLIAWNWDFGDGFTSQLQNPTHTYLTPGLYQTTLIVTSASGCQDTFTLDSIQIFGGSLPPPPKIYSVTVLDEVTDSLSWEKYSGLEFFAYSISRETPPGTGNYIQIGTHYDANDTTFVDQVGINTLASSHCYKIGVLNTCGLASDITQAKSHCTLELTASPGIRKNILNWSPYFGWGPVQQYNIFRSDSWDYLSAIQIGTVPGSIYTFEDSNVVCYKTYHYRVQAISPVLQNQVSWSDTSWSMPDFPPNQTAGEIIYATVENNSNIKIEWKPITIPYSQMIFLDRSSDGQNWAQLTTLSPSSVLWYDFLAEVHKGSYFYRISVLDSCSDFSPFSNPGRSIFLQTSIRSGSPYLDWNPYSLWSQGVNFYEVEVWNEQSGMWEWVGQTPGNTPVFLDAYTHLDQDQYCYRVRAIEFNGNFSFSLSNESCVEPLPALFAPTAFTPNGDLLNDEFNLVGRFVNQYHLSVFDRWGNLIFETRSLLDGWNGKFRNLDCPEGVYIWTADGVGNNDDVLHQTGTITLIR